MNAKTNNTLYNHISKQLAWEYRIIPNNIEHDVLTLLIDENVYNEAIAEELEVLVGNKIILKTEKSTIITEQLIKNYRKNDTNLETTQTKNVGSSDSFLIEILNEANNLNSSDIHIESYSEKSRIRFRIDGKLIQRFSIPKNEYAAFINKIKINSQLDIAEKRLPQDGRMRVKINDNFIDIRVSILPSLYGEKVVLRLLNNDSSHINLESIGLNEKQLKDFNNTLKKQSGIILISGPTGSGKTTTLYATLKRLNSEDRNILTIEDPIEYTLDGVNQVQLKENIGLTFSSALKTFLRQDPDIIMLGEIRDPDTAQMAIRAALTGHLVLSTIHTNSAWSTISRLVDMGIPNFLLAETINLTAAQRLVRKLCDHCKQEQLFKPSDYPGLNNLLNNTDKHFEASGCNKCYYTGYNGRIAIFEIIPINHDTASLIKENIQDISTDLKRRNIITLKVRAIELIKSGNTSIEEVYPVLIDN